MNHNLLYPDLTVNDAGHLTIAGFDALDLAQQFGTPLMLLNEDKIRDRCRLYAQTLQSHFPPGSMALYASKALSFKHIYHLAAQEGLGVDVVSPGELYTAYKAGFPMDLAYFHGNNKSDADIAFAISHQIGCIVCDNMDELSAIDDQARRAGITQDILLRLTPGIDPHTHAKINTGRIDSKFGAAIDTGQAEALLCKALSLSHVNLRGVHCHIGSQIFDFTPFCDALTLMLAFLSKMKREHGYEAERLNLGGGMGVPYVASDPAIDYAANLRTIAKQLDEQCRAHSLTPPALLLEPGRSLVADAGVTLYTVGGVKKIPGFKNYVSVDGGMCDNPRYTLYQSEYTVYLANRMNDTPDFRCTVAGRCCESGDLLQENVLLPEPRRGDLLAMLTTGAYHYSMASNYNRIPRPAVVMLTGEGPKTAVRRESLDDLILNDL